MTDGGEYKEQQSETGCINSPGSKLSDQSTLYDSRVALKIAPLQLPNTGIKTETDIRINKQDYSTQGIDSRPRNETKGTFSFRKTPRSLPLALPAPHEEQTKTNSVALSPRANYTDWATTTFRRNLVSTFVDRGVSRGQRGGSPTVVNLSFLDRSHYFSFK
jgi:hypothetical protein